MTALRFHARYLRRFHPAIWAGVQISAAAALGVATGPVVTACHRVLACL
ncbi:hypothetical protein [Sphingomonas sp.]